MLSWTENFVLSVIHLDFRGFSCLLLQESQKNARGQEPKWNHPLHVPDCLLVHLKTFCLREYQGLESELEFVRYILQNARVLETMTLYIPSSLDSEAKLQIGRDLSILQRNFESCNIVFHDWTLYLKRYVFRTFFSMYM